MSIKILARKLLTFLHQNEDYETEVVLKTLAKKPHQFFKNDVKESLPIKDFKSPSPKVNPPVITAPKQEQAASNHTPIPQLSIYDKLAAKIKKACPELHIKEKSDLIKNVGIPDCDVIILTDAVIPEVYQSLAKAIDKQLALTETVFLNSNFMQDLLTKSYKLILAPPHAKHIPSFMEHVKVTGKKETYIGASPLLFLEDPVTLSTNISKKQVLWQTIKTLVL